MNNPNLKVYIPVILGIDEEDHRAQVVCLSLTPKVKRRILKKIFEYQSKQLRHPEIVVVDLSLVSKELSKEDKKKLHETYNGCRIAHIFDCDLYVAKCKPKIIVLGE